MTIVFIQAKSKSERVPNKNLRILGDKPLFLHSLHNAKKAINVDKIVIDSDSEEILELGGKEGAIPLKRLKYLATNEITGDDLAYWQAINYPESEIIIQLVPTSPFISSVTIDESIKICKEENCSVVGCVHKPLYIWKNGIPDYLKNNQIPNSDKLFLTTYETTGLYVNKTDFVLKNNKRININRCVPIFLSSIEAIDIDTQEDFNFAEIVWKGLHN